MYGPEPPWIQAHPVGNQGQYPNENDILRLQDKLDRGTKLTRATAKRPTANILGMSATECAMMLSVIVPAGQRQW